MSVHDLLRRSTGFAPGDPAQLRDAPDIEGRVSEVTFREGSHYFEFRYFDEGTPKILSCEPAELEQIRDADTGLGLAGVVPSGSGAEPTPTKPAPIDLGITPAFGVRPGSEPKVEIGGQLTTKIPDLRSRTVDPHREAVMPFDPDRKPDAVVELPPPVTAAFGIAPENGSTDAVLPVEQDEDGNLRVRPPGSPRPRGSGRPSTSGSD